jgi:hypothetical protein
LASLLYDEAYLPGRRRYKVQALKFESLYWLITVNECRSSSLKKKTLEAACSHMKTFPDNRQAQFNCYIIGP